MFIFGLTAGQVEARRQHGSDSGDLIAASPILAEVLASVAAGVFSPDERDRYKGLVNSLRHHDYFLVCADFDSYYAAQRRIADLWRRPDDWWQASILNTANVGWFSSDRSIREYADQVWNVPTYTAP
jgi:glycogen phosphorylase